MLYYRFRPVGELVIKELLYDEVFFASTTECNDPFDGAAFLSFAPDIEKWERLVGLAWRRVDFPGKNVLQRQTAEHLVELCPLAYSKARAVDFCDVLARLDSSPERHVAAVLGDLLARSIHIFEPRRPYFASFARSADNALMWAHYSSMHQGHCLVFKAIDGKLQQCPRRCKKAIARTVDNGIAPRMQSSIPSAFAFEDVKYEDDTPPGDAFACFPAGVSGRRLAETERLALNRDHRSRVLTKHSCWSYEQEARVTMYPPISGLFGEAIALTRQERLLHFRPTQLVGIILGARMPESDRDRFTEIVRSRIERITPGLGNADPYLDFVAFQAELSHDSRRVNIVPKRIHSLTGEINEDASNFGSTLQAWRDGMGLLFEGSKTSRRQFV